MSYKVFYDAKCPLCSSMKKVIGKLDWFQKIEWIPVQQAEKMDKYAFLKGRDIYNRIHMTGPKGEIYSGFYTIRKILNLLILTYPFSLLLYLPLMDKLFAPLYMWVSTHRYEWFGRIETNGV